MTRRNHDRSPRPETSRREFAEGRPGYHDPTAGWGGAPDAVSALTLRLVLAVFGLLVCTAGAVVMAVASAPTWLIVLFIAGAAAAAIDIVVIVRRKRRGEPG